LSKELFENKIRESNNESSKHLWNSQTSKSINKDHCFNTIEYKEYMNDDKMLKKALQSILKYGAALIENVI
jgi:hypothetical protein